MAILNNLIVHGRSRFLNGINANSIHTDLIDANDGVFKTITTTTLDASTITTDMLKANNARVSQTLAVDGTISTNKWEAASIANIGGNFYISPTGKADSGTITVTKNGSTTINGVTVGTYTIVVSGIFGVTSTSNTIWGTNSKVTFTGSISYPKMTGTDLSTTGKKYPLGSCNGTMTVVSTGTGTLTGFTITGINSSALDIFFKEVGITSVSSTVCSGYEMQISVYQSYYSSTLHPIGILLTSYGKEKKQYIDIYGGANTLGDAASGFAEPSVRIGQLDGLPDIRGGETSSTSPTKPTGWGIYTTNGFFKGKIVSNAGLIANFTINGSKLYSNGKSSYSAAATNGGIYIGDDYISFGDGTKTYFYKDGTGQVGPWALSTTYFRNGKIASAINTTVSGVYLGTDGLNISNGTAATTSYITKSAVNIGNKLTWNGTTLSVNGNITSTSGQIGPWFINANSISRNASGNAAGSYDTASNMYFGTSGISLGTTFKVTDAGVLTATNAILKTVSLQDSSGNTRATVDANGLIVKDTSGNTASIFGAGTATIGYTGGDNYNINITGTAIDLRYNTNVLNRINSGGMTLYDGDGVAESNQIASFGETITIGKYQRGAGALEITNKKISLGVTTRGNDGSFMIDNDATISPAVTIGYNSDKYRSYGWRWSGQYVYIDPREIRMRMGRDASNREITPFRAVASSFLTQSEGQSYIAKTIYLNGEQGLGAGETAEFILEFVGFEPSIIAEFDVNGNKIVSDSTITKLSQSDDYSTYRLTIPSTYSGANIYKIYVFYMIFSVLPSVVVGGRPDRTEWDLTIEELEDEPYVGDYCLPGWLPYPFVVGTGNARTEREAGVDGIGGYGQGVNGFVVDWHGNIMARGMAGMIQMFAGPNAKIPPGWLLCDGSSYLRSDYPTLFNALGGTSSPWGLPDSTHFNVPDLRGRAPIGAGTGTGLTARSIGTTLGSEAMQKHLHGMSHTHGTGDSSCTHFNISNGDKVTRRQLGSSGTNRGYQWTTDSTSSYAAVTQRTATAGPSSTNTGYSGTGEAGNMQPSAVVNFIICTGKTS